VTQAFDTVIRGGQVVTDGKVVVADLAIRDGRIAAIGADLPAGATEIAATGRYVMPGGVDPHAHIEQLSGMGVMNADTFETATRSAAMGGTTTVISFAAQQKGQTLSETVADYKARAARGAMIDHAFHLSLADITAPDFDADLARLIGAGHRSIKVFTTYNIKLDDRAILHVMAVARKTGALVCVHAENDGLIGWARDALITAGLTQPRHHAPSHPRLAEIEAVERMCRFAEFFATPVMLFHISTREALEVIRSARARGVPVWAETCPHYLLMTDDVLDRPGNEGAKWMCSPPQRSADDQDALWAALDAGDLDVISSDHAPYRFDASGKLSAGPQAGFADIANGLPGLETRLPLLFDAMVSKGRLGPAAFAEYTATAPARIYGLETKGRLEVGLDADVVVWDPKASRRYGADDLHDNVGYNPWEGRDVTGWPTHVLSRGDMIVQGGAFQATPGRGKWLRRDRIGVASRIAPAHEVQIIEGAMQ
jgi:dihydropyrimidinase